MPIIRSTCLLAGLFVFNPLTLTVAQRPSLSIRVVTTFDYPGTGNSTTPHSIDSRGDCTGTYLDVKGVTRGFVRFHDGQFSMPIVDPNDTGSFTFALGLNASHRICGYYLDGNNSTYHGFLRTGNTYSTFDISGAVNTFLLNQNDAGYLVGSFDDSSGIRQAFFELGGFVMSFSVGSSPATDANSLNATNEIVGDYYDSRSATYHGFFRDSGGTVRSPLDFPGSTFTILLAINNNQVVVGRYVDTAGQRHGLVLKLPGKFVSYDFPGATGTSLNGINDAGFISGRYTDSSGINHGFIARLH